MITSNTRTASGVESRLLAQSCMHVYPGGVAPTIDEF